MAPSTGRFLKCSVRLLFSVGTVACAVLFALSLLYLLYQDGAGGSTNLRDFMVGLVCAEFALFFLMLRGAFRADGTRRTEDQDTVRQL